MMSNKHPHFEKQTISSLLLTLFLFSMISTSIFPAVETIQKIEPQSEQTSTQAEPPSASAEFGDHLKYVPLGIYLQAPNFVQLRQYSEEVSNFQIRAIDMFNWQEYRDYQENSPFRRYEVFFDGALIDWRYDEPIRDIYVDLRSLDDTIGTVNFTVRAWHVPSRRWIPKQILVETVSDDTPCLTPYYSDFVIDTNLDQNLNWKVDNIGNFNWTLSIDGGPVDNGMNNPEIILYTGSYWTNLNGIGNHEISLVVEDVASSKTTTNTFWVRTKSDQLPYINDFYESNNDPWSNPCDGYKFWEQSQYHIGIEGNQPGQVRLLARSNNEEDRSWFKPFKALPFVGNQYIDFTISPNELGYNSEENWKNNFLIRAMPVDAAGLTKFYEDHTYDHQYYVDDGYSRVTHMKVPIEPTRTLNGTTVADNITHWVEDDAYEWDGYEEYVGQVEYEFYFIIDSTAPTALNFYGIGGNGFSRSYQEWYPRQQYQQDKTDDYRDDEDMRSLFEYKQFNGDSDFSAGIVFVIDFVNPDSIELPIKIKLTYPDIINPDLTLGELPLRLLRWQTDCNVENGRGYWNVMDPSHNKTLTGTSVELYIYESGLYAFGADYVDYHFSDANRPPFIPGYPLMMMISAVGICSVFLMRTIKNKRNK